MTNEARIDSRATARSIPNPLRIIGVARVLAGAWFIATGVATLRQSTFLVPQAQRLFFGDIGATDAPIRALLALITAAGLVVIGLVLAVKGSGWTGRLRVPAERPAPIDRDEVIAALRRRQLLTYADGTAGPSWPLRRWLADELADMASWRREIVIRSVRTFLRSCGFALVVAAGWYLLSLLTTNQLLGPFPASFVVVLPFVTLIGAALVLLLIAPMSPRIESVEFPLPARANWRGEAPTDEIIESPPRMLNREPAGLGITLGVAGVAVQCFMLAWWTLSPIGYPLLATSIIRHTGSIAGGILFFLLGHRMVTAASALLMRFPYDSILVLIDHTDHGTIARGAEARTESAGLTGPRRVVALVGGTYARESAEKLIEESRRPGAGQG